MKSIIANMAVAILIVAGSAMAADMPELALKYGCNVCHAIDKKVVFPSSSSIASRYRDAPAWNDVAEKYRGDASAEAKLIYLVQFGSWDSTSNNIHPMYAGGRTGLENIEALVQFVLSLNPPVNASASKPASNPPADTSTSDPTTECITQIKSKKELQILNGKIELDGSANYSFEKLANKSVPTDKEKKAISLWVSEHKRCKQLGYEWRSSKYPPTLIALVDKLYSDIIFVAADLYAKKISYGDFAKGVVKADQEFNANIAAAIQQLRQQQQAEQQQREALAKQQKNQQQQMQQQQDEQQQRKAWAKQQQDLQIIQILQQQNSQAQQAWQQQQQQYRPPVYSAPRTTQSTCGWQGNQWVCNTQPTGIDASIYNNLNTHFGEELGKVFQPR